MNHPGKIRSIWEEKGVYTPTQETLTLPGVLMWQTHDTERAGKSEEEDQEMHCISNFNF